MVAYNFSETGQSLWLNGVTRDVLNSDSLRNYIEEERVTGLAFNLDSFRRIIENSSVYDSAIQKKIIQGKLSADLFIDMALEDLRHAADHLRSVYEKSDGVNGWVSLEISPLLFQDTDSIVSAARELYERGQRPNIIMAIPGTAEGLIAVEKTIAAGVPVNVELLFSHDQYLAAAAAVLSGIEKRIDVGLTPNIHSVASMCIEAWNTVPMKKVPKKLRNQIGLAIARQSYKAWHEQQRST